MPKVMKVKGLGKMPYYLCTCGFSWPTETTRAVPGGGCPVCQITALEEENELLRKRLAERSHDA